jgi:hypothetical protein
MIARQTSGRINVEGGCVRRGRNPGLRGWVGLAYWLCRSERQMEVSRRNCISRNEPEAVLGHHYMRLYYGGFRGSHLPCDVEPYCVLRGDRYAEGLSNQNVKHNNSIASPSGRAWVITLYCQETSRQPFINLIGAVTCPVQGSSFRGRSIRSHVTERARAACDRIEFVDSQFARIGHCRLLSFEGGIIPANRDDRGTKSGTMSLCQTS